MPPEDLLDLENPTQEVETEIEKPGDAFYDKPDTEKVDDEPKTGEGKPSEESESEQVAEGDADKPVEESDKDSDKTDTAPDKETQDKDQDGDNKEIEYSLKLSDDTFLSDSKLTEVQDFAKTHGLSNDAAQEMLNREDNAIANFVIKSHDQQEALISDWAEQTKNDPQLGGDNLKETVIHAKKAAEAFGSESFIKEIRETGYGNHPEFVRFLSKIGSLMSDDKLILTGAHGENKTTEELFYGKPK